MSTSYPNQRSSRIDVFQDSEAVAQLKPTGVSLGQLLSSPTVQVLDELTRRIPPSITSLWGYELPLHVPDKTSDFLLCVHQPEAFVQAFAREGGLESIIAEPVYPGLRELARRWANPDDLAGQFVNNVWLEYDYENLLTGNPFPNFFYGPKSTHNPLVISWATRQLMEPLRPGSLSDEVFHFLLTCVLRLEKQGRITQIGQMLARNATSLRLFIQQLPANAILPYLRKLHYPHVRNRALINQLERCYKLADSVDLDIDITDRIGESIGLECYFDTTEKALLFLADLTKQGLCLPDKYEAVRACLLHPPAHDAALRFMFSHVKLGYKPGAGFSAKVYLGYVAANYAPRVIRTQPIRTL